MHRNSEQLFRLDERSLDELGVLDFCDMALTHCVGQEEEGKKQAKRTVFESSKGHLGRSKSTKVRPR